MAKSENQQEDAKQPNESGNTEGAASTNKQDATTNRAGSNQVFDWVRQRWENIWQRGKEKTDEDNIKKETTADENFSKEYLKDISSAEWALPQLDIKTPEGHPFFKQKGFNIAQDVGMVEPGIEGQGYKEALKELTDSLHKDEEYINKELDKYEALLNDKIKHDQERINAEKSKIDEIESEKKALLEQRKVMEDRKQEAERKLYETKRELADAKSNFLDKWFEEVKQRLQDLSVMNSKLVTDKMELNRQLYNYNSKQNEEIVKTLESGKADAEAELIKVHERMKAIGEEGVTPNTAKFLVRFGYFASIAASCAFSIFTLKTFFASSDIVFYLFQGLQKMAHGMPGTGYSRIFQWMGVLGIVTLAGLICRSISVHVKKRQLTIPDDNTDEHELSMHLKNGVMSYSGKVKATNWLLFWMGILPTVFMLGIVVIFLSFYSGYDALSRELDFSMSGIAMGGFMALAMAGISYLYIIKILEPRLAYVENNNGRRRLWHVWELLLVAAVFLGCVSYMAFHMHGIPITEDVKNKGEIIKEGGLSLNEYGFVSLLLYISTSLLTGFCIGYGLRYRYLIQTEEDLQNKILWYTSIIDRYNGPVRIWINRALETRMDKLLQRLMVQLEKRNDKIHIDKRHQRIKRLEGSAVKVNFTNWLEQSPIYRYLKKIFQQLVELFMSIFLPSEKDKEENEDYASLNIEYEYDLEPWEREYFSALYSKIESYQSEIEFEKKNIEEADKKIADIENDISSPRTKILQRIEEIKKDIAIWEKLIKNVGLARKKAIANLYGRYGRAQDLLKQGYDLGILYINAGFGKQALSN